MMQYQKQIKRLSYRFPLSLLLVLGVQAVYANPYWDSSTSATPAQGSSAPIEGVLVSAASPSNTNTADVNVEGAQGAQASVGSPEGTFTPPNNQPSTVLQTNTADLMTNISTAFQKNYIATLPTAAASNNVATDLENLTLLVQTSWSNYFSLKKNDLFSPNGLNLLWTGMDYQDLNTLPNVVAPAISGPVMPILTVTVNPDTYDRSGNQVGAVVNEISRELGALYTAPANSSSGTDNVASGNTPQESQMQVLQNAVLAPFQNPANTANNPGWLAQINTASNPQLLRAIAVELALSNAINFQQLKTEQWNLAAEGQILAEQLKIETQLHGLSGTIGAGDNTTDMLLEQRLQQGGGEYRVNKS